MNYKQIYDNLISHAKNRVLENVYTEDHHIVPKCMGGTETVPLLAREHFIAHLLLVKIYSNEVKLWYALWRMCNCKKGDKYKISSRDYEKIREDYNKKTSGENAIFYGKHHSEGTKEKLRKANKGRIRTEEFKKHDSETHKGKKFTEEHKKKIIENHKGMKGMFHSIESRKKISEATKGKNNPRYINVSKDKQIEIINGYLNGESMEKLRNIIGCSCKKIQNILKDNNIKIRTIKESKNFKE